MKKKKKKKERKKVIKSRKLFKKPKQLTIVLGGDKR